AFRRSWHGLFQQVAGAPPRPHKSAADHLQIVRFRILVCRCVDSELSFLNLIFIYISQFDWRRDDKTTAVLGLGKALESDCNSLSRQRITDYISPLYNYDNIWIIYDFS